MGLVMIGVKGNRDEFDIKLQNIHSQKKNKTNLLLGCAAVSFVLFSIELYFIIKENKNVGFNQKEMLLIISSILTILIMSALIGLYRYQKNKLSIKLLDIEDLRNHKKIPKLYDSSDGIKSCILSVDILKEDDIGINKTIKSIVIVNKNDNNRKDIIAELTIKYEDDKESIIEIGNVRFLYAIDQENSHKRGEYILNSINGCDRLFFYLELSNEKSNKNILPGNKEINTFIVRRFATELYGSAIVEGYPIKLESSDKYGKFYNEEYLNVVIGNNLRTTVGDVLKSKIIADKSNLVYLAIVMSAKQVDTKERKDRSMSFALKKLFCVYNLPEVDYYKDYRGGFFTSDNGNEGIEKDFKQKVLEILQEINKRFTNIDKGWQEKSYMSEKELDELVEKFIKEYYEEEARNNNALEKDVVHYSIKKIGLLMENIVMKDGKEVIKKTINFHGNTPIYMVPHKQSEKSWIIDDVKGVYFIQGDKVKGLSSSCMKVNNTQPIVQHQHTDHDFS